MPRKKAKTAVTPIESAPVEATLTDTANANATATLEAPTPTAQDSAQPDSVPTTQGPSAAPADGPTDGTGKNYGPPYRAVLVTPSFEMGENRRYKQRVFMFKEKPDEQTRALLKESGFTFRPAEKAWTIPATAESRVMSDRLARVMAGQTGHEQSYGRG